MHFLVFLMFSLCFSSCAKQEDQEQAHDEASIQGNQIEEEWTSLNNLEGKEIAEEFLPDPQEIIFRDLPEQGLSSRL